MSGAIRVRDDMLLAACKYKFVTERLKDSQWNSLFNLSFLCVYSTAEALAAQVTEENFANGLIYPPFSNIREISANIAASVAATTYDLG